MAASGGLYYRTAAGAWARVAIGSGTGGTSTFLGLTDSPSSYSGEGSKVVSVKSDESGLEFTTASSGTSFDTNFLATMSSDINVSNNTWTKATFDTVTTDDNSEWDAVNTRWVCKEDGVYAVFAILTFVKNGTGARGVDIYKNGAFNHQAYGSFYSSGGTVTTRPFINSPLALVVGDYLEAWGVQWSGTTLELTGATSYWAIHRIH